jgi:hypothetical protein
MAVTVIPNFATDNTQRSGYVNDGQHTSFGGTWTRASAANPLQLHIFAHFSLSTLAAISADLYLSAAGAPATIAGVYVGLEHFTSDSNDIGPYPARWVINQQPDGSYMLTLYKLGTPDLVEIGGTVTATGPGSFAGTCPVKTLYGTAQLPVSGSVVHDATGYHLTGRIHYEAHGGFINFDFIGSRP